MKAKQEGWGAFFDGVGKNPYPAGSIKRTYWNRGWKAAEQHALPLTFDTHFRRTPNDDDRQSFEPGNLNNTRADAARCIN